MFSSRYFPVWSPILLLVLFLTGCTQRETDIGLDAVNTDPGQEFTVVSGSATAMLGWNPKTSNGRGASLQVGDAASYFAFSALQFNPDAVLPESVRVDCMIVTLHRNRIWPENGAAEMQVRVREVQERWTEDSLIAGTLPGRETYPILDSLLFPASDVTFSYTVPESLWSRWVADDTTTWGLLFEPKSIGTLMDFYSSEEEDSLSAAIEIFGVQWEQVDTVWTDTLFYAKQFAVHDAYLAVNSAEWDSTRFAMSQGFPGRVAFYFPLDSISANFRYAATHAELYIYADTTHVANMLYSSVGLLYKDGTMTDIEWLTVSSDSARGGLVATVSTAFSAGEFLSFDVSDIVQDWVAVPESNTGFQVVASEENGHLTRQLFHSSTSEDTTKRPRLKLWLSEQQ